MVVGRKRKWRVGNCYIFLLSAAPYIISGNKCLPINAVEFYDLDNDSREKKNAAKCFKCGCL